MADGQLGPCVFVQSVSDVFNLIRHIASKRRKKAVQEEGKLQKWRGVLKSDRGTRELSGGLYHAHRSTTDVAEARK
jgi:hypothetical protein